MSPTASLRPADPAALSVWLRPAIGLAAWCCVALAFGLASDVVGLAATHPPTPFALCSVLVLVLLSALFAPGLTAMSALVARARRSRRARIKTALLLALVAGAGSYRLATRG